MRLLNKTDWCNAYFSLFAKRIDLCWKAQHLLGRTNHGQQFLVMTGVFHRLEYHVGPREGIEVASLKLIYW